MANKWHREYPEDDEEIIETNTEETNPEPITPEETTWKKRYGDLRSWSTKEINTLKNDLDNIKKQLDASTKNNIKLPKTPEEIKAWAQQYPDVAAIVRTIAIEENTKS